MPMNKSRSKYNKQYKQYQDNTPIFVGSNILYPIEYNCNIIVEVEEKNNVI